MRAGSLLANRSSLAGGIRQPAKADAASLAEKYLSIPDPPMLFPLTLTRSRSAVRQNGSGGQNRSSHILSPRIAPRVPLKAPPNHSGQAAI